MTTSDYLDPLYFRNDLVRPLFDLVRAGESFAVVAPASMGKSRLTRFIMRDDVQRHALGEQASTTRLVLCDFNRLAEVSDWGMYEVILASLIEACDPPAREPLLAMQRDVITSHNGLLAQRHVELAALMLTREHGLKLCLLLDEFDELCRKLSPLALSSLRALRDANKYQVCFGTFVRDHPARLRPPLEYEGFYELLSRSVLWLGPYQSQDALDMIDLLARRRQRELAPEVRHRIVNLGGGHPGMTNALFDVFSANPDKHRADFDINAMLTGTVEEEAHKLWDSLADDERLALSHVATGIPPNVEAGQLLLNKGILCSGGDGFTIFSPVFGHFVKQRGAPVRQQLWVDAKASVVWVGDTPHRDLTSREFELLRILYATPGEVRTRDDIHRLLYPGDKAVAGNAVDALVKKVRAKIEPARRRPCYLITVHGRGYKLNTNG